MALADTITNLGNSIIALVGTRAKKDLSNIDEAGVEKIKSYAGGGGSNPVGTVIAYMGRTVPDGYLLMDGREVSKETYADLYAVVGDTMGTATDPTKFVIANMTDGRYLMGSTVAGASQASGAPNISAIFRTAVQDTSGSSASGAVSVALRVDKAKIVSGTWFNDFLPRFTFNASRSNGIYGRANTIIPLSRRCLFLIKY